MQPACEGQVVRSRRGSAELRRSIRPCATKCRFCNHELGREARVWLPGLRIAAVLYRRGTGAAHFCGGVVVRGFAFVMSTQLKRLPRFVSFVLVAATSQDRLCRRITSSTCRSFRRIAITGVGPAPTSSSCGSRWLGRGSPRPCIRAPMCVA